jgi:hypothetical protein
MDDDVRRKLSCDLTPEDTAEIIAAELVLLGFVSKV